MDNFNPEVLRSIKNMYDFDTYDLLAHHSYHASALKRQARWRSSHARSGTDRPSVPLAGGERTVPVFSFGGGASYCNWMID
jgi:hypothetical protein